MDFDLVVIGAGPAGYVGALRASTLGLKTAVVEKNQLGGTCLNVGCIPTKAMLHCSELYDQLRRADKLGIRVGEASLDFSKVQGHKSGVIDRLRKGIAAMFKAKGVELIQGTARLDGANTVRVELSDGKRTLSARNVLIATGSRPARPPVFPFDQPTVMTTDDVLDLPKLPESILCVGAGAIGCEYATMFAEFGCRVYLVEMLERILPNVDADVSKEIGRALKRRGVAVHAGTKITELKAGKSGVKAALDSGKSIEADIALIGVGRATDTKTLGLDTAGVKHDGRFIQVNDRMKTNVAGVYAAGEIAGSPQLAHTSSRGGVVAVENMAGKDVREDFRIYPAAFFTHPEVGVVGLSESEAKEKGFAVKTARFPLQAIGIAQAYAAEGGFAKLIAEKETGEVLGAAVVAPHAADVVQEAALAMKQECCIEELAETIHSHPTFSEILMEAADVWIYGR